MDDIFTIRNNFAEYASVQSKLVWGALNRPKPEFTIAIPTFRRPHLLKDAINSAINQIGNFQYEVIVVDNDDDFSKISEVEKMIKEYDNPQITYYRNEQNIGMFGNWNRCIELARSEWITILNDDDWLEPNYLLEMHNFLARVKANIIFVDFKIRDFRIESQKIITIKSKIKNMVRSLKKMIFYQEYRKTNWFDFFLGPQSSGSLGVLFNKNLAIQYGGFNQSYYPASDYYFWGLYAINEKAYRIRKELVNYRILENESLYVAREFPYCNMNFRKGWLKKNQLKIGKIKRFLLAEISESIFNEEQHSTAAFFGIKERRDHQHIRIKDRFILFILKLRKIFLY